MKPIRKIKHSLYNFFLRKKLSAVLLPRKTINLNKAKKIGILFNATDPGNYVVVDKYAKKLKAQDKKVELYGYFNFSNVEGDLNYPYFSKKDFNFYSHPKNNSVEYFLNQDYDILINAYVEDNLPLEYMSTFSKSKFRIGLYRKNNIYYSDVMIKQGKEQPVLEEMLKEFDHYLKMIENNEN